MDKKFDKMGEGKPGGGGKQTGGDAADSKGGQTPAGMKPVGQVKEAKPVGRVDGKG